MPDTPMNYPPMPEEKLKKLQHYYENGLSVDGIPKKVQEHLARVKSMGGGQGIGISQQSEQRLPGRIHGPLLSRRRRSGHRDRRPARWRNRRR